MSTIYYLQRHTIESEHGQEAGGFFHEFHIDPPDSLTKSEFDKLYEQVAETDTSHLETSTMRVFRSAGRKST